MAPVLWICFKLSTCLFGNTRDTSVIFEKVKFISFIFIATTKSEIQIYSYKQETNLV